MEWKTIACLLVALAAAALGALVPATVTVAGTVTGLALGMLMPQPKTWGKNGAVAPKSSGQDETPVTVPNPTRVRVLRPRNRGLSNLELLLAVALLGTLLFLLAKMATP